MNASISVSLGNYQLQRQLGTFSSFKIFSAVDRQSGRQVVLSALSPELAASQPLRIQFLSHFKQRSKLQHPHLSRQIEVQEEEGWIFSVLEGGTPIDEAEVDALALQSLLGQLCDALSYLHAQGLVHGDICPWQVLVNAQGQLRLLYLGALPEVALGIPDHHPHLDYKSPAQRKGEQPTPACDLYACGVLLQLFSEQLSAHFDAKALRMLAREALQPSDFPLSILTWSERLQALGASRSSAVSALRRMLRTKMALIAMLLLAIGGSYALYQSAAEPVRISQPKLAWKFRTAGKLSAAPLYQHGQVFVGGQDGQVYALDTNKGAPRWRVPVGGRVRGRMAADSGKVYVASSQGRIAALDQQTGRTLWDYQGSSAFLGDVCRQQDMLYAVDLQGGIHALEAQDGSLRWKRSIPGSAGSAVSATDELVYVSNAQGMVQALDAYTGDVRWQVHLQMSLRHAPLLYKGMLYLGGENRGKGYLIALDAYSGELLERKDLDTPLHAAPVCDGDHLFLYAGRLQALRLPDLSPAWEVSAPGGDCLWPDGQGGILLGGEDGILRAFDAQGKERWNFLTTGALSAPPALADGLLFLCSEDGYVYGVR